MREYKLIDLAPHVNALALLDEGSFDHELSNIRQTLAGMFDADARASIDAVVSQILEASANLRNNIEASRLEALRQIHGNSKKEMTEFCRSLENNRSQYHEVLRKQMAEVETAISAATSNVGYVSK